MTDDDVFGTREKKKVGDRWPINATVAATALESDFKITTESHNIKGFVALDGAARNSENDYLIVSGELEIDEFSVPVPDGMKMEEGQFAVAFTGSFPSIKPGSRWSNLPRWRRVLAEHDLRTKRLR